MQKMPKKYYAFFTLPTLIAFVDRIFYSVSTWYLSFIYQIHHSDQFTMGRREQLCSRFY